MKRLKTKAAKESLLRRVRRQRLKSITILPSLVTILNAVCGFTAIVMAGNGRFALSGYMILLAMIADMLDGRLARMSQTTSSFGGQLDSLCDIISFGVAPAFLTLRILEYKLGQVELNPALEQFLYRFISVAAAAYVSCAAIRLARFNVENEEDESAHMSFVGLPTPAAAGVSVSLIIFHQEALTLLRQQSSNAYVVGENIIVYSLPLMLLGTAVLMVSRIRYPHILNQYIRGKKPFAHLIRAVLFLGLMFWSRQAALVLIFCGFAASGFAKWLYHRLRKTSSRARVSEKPAVALGGSSADVPMENGD